MSQSDTIRILLSGGGTGGHIFPAIAIADAIKDRIPEAEFLFVGANGRMEMQKVPEAGYSIIGLWISGFHRKLTMDNFSFPFKVISSLLKARKIIRTFKPDVVIGTGGYASGPTLRAASFMGIPTLIQEQNSFPGITNKMLAKNTNTICVAYEEMDKFFPASKIRLTGNPIRMGVSKKTPQQEALEAFRLKPGKTTLLVIGGSLGARTINHCIQAGIETLRNNDIQLIWQTGKSYAETAESAVKCYPDSGLTTTAFISRMDLAYSAADLVVSRAGAIAISELCMVGKPSILVPSPNVTDDHQTKNALALLRNKAALMVKDTDAGSELIREVVRLANTKELRLELSINIRKMAHPDAAARIADEAIKLTNRKK